MNTILTTITPCWGRQSILVRWLKCLECARHPGVSHLVMFVGEPVPAGIQERYKSDPHFRFVSFPDDTPGFLSIGHYHNWAAKEAGTEWIMKLDVDALPHDFYFTALVPLLFRAAPRDWFNGGMFYLTPGRTSCLFQMRSSVSLEFYSAILDDLQNSTEIPHIPAASNFICRRQDYLDLGGCDPRFRGYGWEDYQQLYMLERHRLGKCPFDRNISLRNITQRCRDELSRRKAGELWKCSRWLCLLHHWHSKLHSGDYRSNVHLENNRRVLFDYCREHD